MTSNQIENIARDRDRDRDTIHFNKIKTNIKKNNKNKSKCTVFMTEDEYNDMFNFYLERRKKTIGKYAHQKGYLKISNDKYIKVGFYMTFFNPLYSNESRIICKITGDEIDPSNICFVENYNNYNDYFNNRNKRDGFENLRNAKNHINRMLKNLLDNIKILTLKNSLESLFVEFFYFIEKYEKVLDIEILTNNTVNKIQPNKLNKNNFYNNYYEEIINLFDNFIETRIWNYNKFQDILNKISILIYKYNKITNHSISRQLKNIY